MDESTHMSCAGDWPARSEPLAMARYEPLTMARIHRQWCEYSRDDGTLKECFQFVRYKMNVVRDFDVIASDKMRREFCVALYEYRHKILAPSKDDIAFIARYEDGR